MNFGQTLNVKKTKKKNWNKCSFNHRACSHIGILSYAVGWDVHISTPLNELKQGGLHTCTNMANLIQAGTVVYLQQTDQNTSRDDHTLALHCAQPLLILAGMTTH